MAYRWTDLRVVDPSAHLDRRSMQPLSLWWAALAAADETAQGSTLTGAWLGLFRAHLSQHELVQLRWRADLGESAEIRRAYSSIYGRYFARALLASRLGLTDFISLRTKTTTIPNGVTVKRTRKGDIPDWLAWDPRAGTYVLCEAKGNLTGNPIAFTSKKPACVEAGKKQFDRVEVREKSGRLIATKNWVAANLWSTDVRSHTPVSLLWDPPTNGEVLSEEEAHQNASAIRRRRAASLSVGFRRESLLASRRDGGGFFVKLSAPSSPGYLPTGRDRPAPSDLFVPPDEPATEGHSSEYYAVLITQLGWRPLLGEADVDAALELKARVTRTVEPAMIFGIATNTVGAARADRPLWLAEAGIAAPDGLSLFDLKSVEIGM